MKKFALLLAALCLASATFAVPEKMGSIKATGRAQLVQAATKVGEFVNYPLGVVVGIAVMSEAVEQELGECRIDAPILLLAYLDTAKADAEIDDDDLEAALVLPTTLNKAQFCAKQFKSRERDGIVKYIEAENGKPKYAIFSEDEQWVAVAESREIAQLAAGEFPAARSEMAGDLVQLELTRACMRRMEAAAQRFCDENFDEDMDDALEYIKDMDGIKLALLVNDLGVDLHGAIRVRPGSEFDRMSVSPLTGDVLAFAPAGAQSASVTMVDGPAFDRAGELVREMLASAERNRLDLSWLKRERQGDNLLLELDTVSLIGYLQDEAEQPTFDDKTFQAEIDAIAAKADQIQPGHEYRPWGMAFSVKNRPAPVSPSAKLARILPEVQGRSLNAAAVSSPYGIIRAVAPDVLAAAPDDVKPTIRAVMMAFADNQNGAVAGAAWRDADDYAFVLRVSADELNALSSVVSAVAGAISMQMFK